MTLETNIEKGSNDPIGQPNGKAACSEPQTQTTDMVHVHRACDLLQFTAPLTGIWLEHDRVIRCCSRTVVLLSLVCCILMATEFGPMHQMKTTTMLLSASRLNINWECSHAALFLTQFSGFSRRSSTGPQIRIKCLSSCLILYNLLSCFSWPRS